MLVHSNYVKELEFGNGDKMVPRVSAASHTDGKQDVKAAMATWSSPWHTDSCKWKGSCCEAIRRSQMDSDRMVSGKSTMDDT